MNFSFHRLMTKCLSLRAALPLLCLATVAVSTIQGCKKRRNQSALLQTPEEQAKSVVKDMAAIEFLRDKAQADGWIKDYLDMDSLSDTNLNATIAKSEFSEEEKTQGWPISRQIKGIVGLSEKGRSDLERVAGIIAKHSAKNESISVARSGAYFISWLLHEIGVSYEREALDANLQNFYKGCEDFSECMALITAVATYADVAAGPVIHLLVGDKPINNCLSNPDPKAVPAPAQLYNAALWECLIKDGLPTASKVTPDSLYGQVFKKIESPILRDILTFHLHSLLMNSIFYGELAFSFDITNDKKRNAFVRTPSGRIPSLDDATKALILARISDLKIFHENIVFPDVPVNASNTAVPKNAAMPSTQKAAVPQQPNAAPSDPEQVLVNRLSQGFQTLMDIQFLKKFLGSLKEVITPQELYGANSQDIRRGLIRGMEGVLSIELYLARLGKKEIRPWLDAVSAASTEVAIATLARNMKTEATLPSAQFYNRAFARLIQSSPRVTILDANNVPRDQIRSDYRALQTTFDTLAGMHRGMNFGAYGLQSITQVERPPDEKDLPGMGVAQAATAKELNEPTPKNRLQRGGFLGVFISASARHADKYEQDKGCRNWTDADVEQNFFLSPGTRYHKLSVTNDPNAPENGDFEDPYEKTVGPNALPRLKAFEQDLANRFPNFNSMSYQSGVYTRAASEFALYQGEMLKIFEEEQKRLRNRSYFDYFVYDTLGKFFQAGGDGFVILATGIPKLIDFPRFFGNTWYVDPNWRGDVDSNSELQSKSDAAMKNYLHQFLALNCYNFFTLDDAGFLKDPTVCGPNGKPYHLANICLGLGSNYRVNPNALPSQWTERWNRNAPPLNVEIAMSTVVEEMHQWDVTYQQARRILDTAIQIPVVMIAGHYASLLVSPITAAIAETTMKMTSALTSKLMQASVSFSSQMLSASVNMVSFALVHKSMLFGINAIVYQDLPGAMRGFYDVDKTFYENYAKELASGSFLFFVQPMVGKATDWIFGKMLGISGPEHFERLGNGVSGFRWVQENIRKGLFVSGTKHGDTIFFYTMPYLEKAFLEEIGVETSSQDHTPINAKPWEEFANSYTMAAAFRLHGNLGGHFSTGPNAAKMTVALKKYYDAVARFRKLYDQGATITVSADTSTGSGRYFEGLRAEQNRMQRASDKLNRLIRQYVEANYERPKGPDGKPLPVDRAKIERDIELGIQRTWDIYNEGLKAPEPGGVDMNEFKGIPVGSGGEDVVP